MLCSWSKTSLFIAPGGPTCSKLYVTIAIICVDGDSSYAKQRKIAVQGNRSDQQSYAC